MINPFARQRRLGAALQALRLERGLTIKALRQCSGVSDSVISRLENPLAEVGKRPDLLTVRQLLDGLDVPRDSEQFRTIEGYAETAAGRGWWAAAPYLHMGDGQRDYAIIETGASEISEYAGLYVPGLVQTADVARHWARLADEANADAVVAGRLERQRQVRDVPYRLILEEPALYRRHGIPHDVMREQLEHLLELAEQPKVSIRVLPVRAEIADGPPPRAPFAHVSYPEGEDPPTAIVDGGVKRSYLATSVAEVAGYAQLHVRLCDAAASEDGTAALIRSAAKSLAAK